MHKYNIFISLKLDKKKFIVNWLNFIFFKYKNGLYLVNNQVQSNELDYMIDNSNYNGKNVGLNSNNKNYDCY